jgi:hypothetical protein
VATLDCGSRSVDGHRDKLSFTFCAYDALLIADYGAPGRLSKIVDYYGSTLPHNTVMVDGNSQQPSEPCESTHHYQGEFLHCAEATAEDVYPG